jgi:hypothetical protein
MAGIRIALQLGFETTPWKSRQPRCLTVSGRVVRRRGGGLTITRSHRWGIGDFFAANALITHGLRVSVYEQASALTKSAPGVPDPDQRPPTAAGRVGFSANVIHTGPQRACP